MLKRMPGYSKSLLYRIAACNGGSQRAKAARRFLNTMPEHSTIQLNNRNTTIRVHAGDSSGGVDIAFEVPVGLAMTVAAADGG